MVKKLGASLLSFTASGWRKTRPVTESPRKCDRCLRTEPNKLLPPKHVKNLQIDSPAQGQTVNVVTPAGSPLIEIDSCLIAYGVGRRVALQEMNLPGSVPPKSRAVEKGDHEAYLKAKLPHLQDLCAEGALTKIVYQKGAQRTEATEQFLELIGSAIDSNGCVSKAKVAEIAECTEPVRGKVGSDRLTVTQAWEREIDGQIGNAPHLAALVRVWDRDAEEARAFVNPNCAFLSASELAKALGVDKVRTAAGSTHYLPRGAAMGFLRDFSQDERKQAAKLTVQLPTGFQFLDAWFRAEDRQLRLVRDKYE